MNRKLWLVVALALPILALAGSAYLKSVQRNSGEAVTLPISGFDPRDLLSGHYLIYRVDYGVEVTCDKQQGPASVCLKPKRGFYPTGELPTDCTLFIHGQCNDGAFSAGIERFYIPDAYAQVLEDKVRDRQGELVLAVDDQGNAAIRDLLISGKPWKDTIGGLD
ncbi:GDYXXLXY domain-containing protein [Thiothrix lacustris]|uniref:GDYXXLXY domain-containing protein n=1 Tax=Thiothrix lacustris TaxID=525917 RepID=UPI0004919F25|nr:GDYXXLXY domain-containing protein [Thiothrix lacustris]